jgi:hypothetical protein
LLALEYKRRERGMVSKVEGNSEEASFNIALALSRNVWRIFQLCLFLSSYHVGRKQK